MGDLIILTCEGEARASKDEVARYATLPLGGRGQPNEARRVRDPSKRLAHANDRHRSAAAIIDQTLGRFETASPIERLPG